MGTKRDYLLYKRTNGFYYYKVRDGKWKSTGKKTKYEADQFARLNSRARISGLANDMVLRDFLEPYFTDNCPHITRLNKLGKNVSLRYVKQNRRYMEKYIFQDEISKLFVGDIIRNDIIELMDRVYQQTGSRSLSNKALSILSIAFKEAEYRERIDKDPTKRIQKAVIKHKERPIFSKAQLLELFPPNDIGPWASREKKVCFFLAAATGMRRGEILALRWSNIIIFPKPVGALGGIINVCEAVKDDGSNGILGLPKWEKKRTVPLPAIVLDELLMLKSWVTKDYATGNDYVFCNVDGTRHKYHWWSLAFHHALKKLGLEGQGFVPHCFRHSLNTHLLAKSSGNANVKETLQKTFGWGDDSVHEVYTHLEDKNLGIDHIKSQAKMIENLLI